MGEVAVKYKIMCDPNVDDANADEIANAMNSMASEVGVVQMVETKPLAFGLKFVEAHCVICLLYTSPSPRDRTRSRMPSSA